MSYPLRLPPELDAEARERCASLGISLNALIAVALDAYLRGSRSKAAKPAQKAAKRPAAQAAIRNPTQYHPDPQNWRNFHGPDHWPVHDPDWESDLEEPESFDVDDPEWQAYFKELARRYWATHERPKA